MRDDYTILTTFNFSYEAQVLKSKLDSEGIRTMLMDEYTIDTDPLLSHAIGGVKLLVHKDNLEKASTLFNNFRSYEKNKKGENINCVSCNSTRILVAPPQKTNFLWMLFPFFESRKLICNDCKTIFK